MLQRTLDTGSVSLPVESPEQRDMREKAPQIIDGLADAARRLYEERSAAERYDSFLPEFLNKKGIADVTDKLIAEGRGFGYFILDLDNFKKVNDELGHDVGDEVLKSFAGFLVEAFCRKTDIKAHETGRYGGDEFIVVAPDQEDDDRRNRSPDVLDRIKVVQADYRAEHPHLAKFGIGVSVGAARFDPAHPVDALTLFNQADEDLRRVKKIVHEKDAVNTRS